MLRERLTWFSLGAATMGVVVFLVVGHPREKPGYEVARIVTDDRATANAMAAPAPGRIVQTQSRDQQPVSKAAEAQVPQPNVAAPPMAPPVEEVAISPEQPLRASRQIVTHAIEVGRWSNKDAAALAAVSGTLSPVDRRELYGRLAVAINQDRVHVESGLMPR